MSLVDRLSAHAEQCGLLRQEPRISTGELAAIIEALKRAERHATATERAADSGQRQSVAQRMTLRKLREAMQ